MKKSFFLFLGLAAFICSAGNAWALEINDLKFADGLDGIHLSTGESFISDRHDLNHPDALKYNLLGAPYVDVYDEGDARFRPGDTINSARLDLYMKDDADYLSCLTLDIRDSKKEAATIYVESLQLVEDVEVDGGNDYLCTKKYSYALTGSMLELLGNDGILNFAVTCTQGDFIFLKSVLYADITPQGQPPAPVPEPATVLLLGSGLLGLAGFRKRNG